jgi:hypothetical protein
MAYYYLSNQMGEIISWGDVQVENIVSPLQPGFATPSTHYVTATGVLTEYTPSEAVLKSTQPSLLHIWNNQTMQWQDTRTQEDVLTQQWSAVKAQRDQLLTDSDWRVVKAVDTGESLDPAWKTYRQALRDITTQADPSNISWPVAPNT